MPPTSTATSATGRGAKGEEAAFQRFPTWMWRNTEVDDFVRWLRGHNEGREAARDGRLLRARPLQSLAARSAP